VKGRLARRPNAALLAVAATVAATPVLGGDEKSACLDAYVRAQELEKAQRWVASRDSFESCSRPVCPKMVVMDCAEALPKLDARMPTLVVAAKDATGQDTTAVALFVDGLPVRDHLDVVALPIDPGEHTLTMRLGADTIEQRVVMVEGDKGRRVVADFSTLHHAPSGLASDVPAPPAPTVPPPVPSHTELAPRPIPTSVYVLGAVSLAAFGSFTTAAILGDVQKSDLGACAGHCSNSAYDVMLDRYIVADVSLGVGVLALGATAYLFFTRPHRPATSVGSFDVAPSRHGALGQVRFAF
jgi:hypothetical protein